MIACHFELCDLTQSKPSPLRRRHLTLTLIPQQTIGNTMNTNTLTLVTSPTAKPTQRLHRLQRELQHAWEQTSGIDLAAWGAGSGRLFARAASRRVKNVMQLLHSSARFVGGEASSGWRAWQRDELGDHAQRRAAQAVEAARDGYAQIGDFAGRTAQALKDKPQDTGTHLLTLVLTSLLVSGGPDGDGGAPDLDLMFGIDAHRSILSHSILMGAALEAGLLSLLGLVRLVYQHLPAQHDPLWDSIHSQAANITQAANRGASIGMAYHLLVDGLVQPAPYHDLPVSLPLEVHQAVFVVNAAGEAADVHHKPPKGGPRAANKRHDHS